jgi:hypothetical protein|tara:strand:+ start:3433 stop:4167 length:735 start_codon:yes stop_codon:yes gene_type:complete
MLKNNLSAIIISLAVITGVAILGQAYVKRGNANDTVSVTGMGDEDFTSDLIVWRASFSKKAYELKEAYANLNSDRLKIKKYLQSKGIKDAEVVFQAIDIRKDYSYEYDSYGGQRSQQFQGYVLDQQLKIESNDVNKVEDLSRSASELIDMGMELISYAPEYYYTKLAELKIKMIESATKDAKLRAEKIAENAGGSLGALKNADLGVFQITGQNSSEDYSWGGSFNTSSKKKTASVTIRLKYDAR